MDFEWTAEDDEYRRDVRAFLSEMLPEGWNGYDHSDLESYELESKRFLIEFDRAIEVTDEDIDVSDLHVVDSCR